MIAAPHPLDDNTTRACLLVLSGSERGNSLNGRLARLVVELAHEMGHAAERFSLRDLALPLYDGDLEAASGVPPAVLRLQQAILQCDALLLVTPEYNGFPTPLVINAFDWLSRITASGERPAGLAATTDKPAGLLSASPGPGGALRSMNFLRQYLQMSFAMIVVPQQFALGRAHEAFDAAGRLTDPRALQSVERVLTSVTRLATALRAA